VRFLKWMPKVTTDAVNARRIQARAIRREGELIEVVQPSKGGRPGTSDGGGTGLLTRKKFAADAGLSDRQRITALRVAAVPRDEFDAAVESDNPPTVTALADLYSSVSNSGCLISAAPASKSSADVVIVFARCSNLSLRSAWWTMPANFRAWLARFSVVLRRMHRMSTLRQLTMPGIEAKPGA